MFHTSRGHRFSSAALAIALIVGAGSLTACQSGASTGRVADQGSDRPVIRPERVPHVAIEHSGRPADRIEEALERETERNSALAERFAGMPADRIEEQLIRERGK